MLSMIVAMARNRVIGKDNGMPWHHPEDLKYFKEVTLNKTIIMGSKTFHSIYDVANKPLPKRHHVILTSRPESYPDFETYQSVDEVLKVYQNKEEEVFIIGGATIYEQFLPYADRLYITYIDESYEGDTFFPPFDEDQYELIKQHQSGVLNFCVYERSDAQ